MRIAATSELISPLHRQRYETHYVQQASRYAPHRWQPLVDYLVAQLGAQSVLDYGCGLEGNLAQYAMYRVTNYDPGVPRWAARPGTKHDLVIASHMLEHVEPPCVIPVLCDILWYARKAILLLISCAHSTKQCCDGTDWHISVHDAAWWGDCVQGIIRGQGKQWTWRYLKDIPSLCAVYQENPLEIGIFLIHRREQQILA